MAINHFLIVYNLRDEELLQFQPFGKDVEGATEAYARAESLYRERPDHEDFEIVLVGADSADTLKVTHSRYFKTGEAETVPF